MEGRVVHFDPRGFGFIKPRDCEGADVFFHRSTIPEDMQALVRRGVRVQFDVVDGPKGQRAINVD